MLHGKKKKKKARGWRGASDELQTPGGKPSFWVSIRVTTHSVGHVHPGILEIIPMRWLLGVLTPMKSEASRPGRVLGLLHVSPVPLYLSCYLGDPGLLCGLLPGLLLIKKNGWHGLLAHSASWP